jgi:hypothetical protein
MTSNSRKIASEACGQAFQSDIAHLLAPLLNVDLLPAVWPCYCMAPQLTNPGDHHQPVLERQVGKYQPSVLPDFVVYNNYKNHIINNKNDKSKILNLRMTVRHCQ